MDRSSDSVLAMRARTTARLGALRICVPGERLYGDQCPIIEVGKSFSKRAHPSSRSLAGRFGSLSVAIVSHDTQGIRTR